LESQNVLEVNEPVLIVRPDDDPIGLKHVALNVLLNFNPLNAEVNPICHLLALIRSSPYIPH
jgi:hypothetical protein